MRSVIKKQALRRLQIIQGQIQGLTKMIEAEKYCVDILNQTASIQESLKSLDTLLLENHLETCAVNQIKKGNGKKMTEELLKIYRLSRKRG
ncbi:MAG: metal-sensing transcriptional repressor [Patescibacteria group bacterium]